jgi:hypothetical protein
VLARRSLPRSRCIRPLLAWRTASLREDFAYSEAGRLQSGLGRHHWEPREGGVAAAPGAGGKRPTDREAAGFSEGVGQPEDVASSEAPEQITETWIGTNWIVDVTASGTRVTTPFHATLFLSPPGAPPQTPCCNWCAISGGLRAGTGSGRQLHEVALLEQGNGAAPSETRLGLGL